MGMVSHICTSNTLVYEVEGLPDKAFKASLVCRASSRSARVNNKILSQKEVTDRCGLI